MATLKYKDDTDRAYGLTGMSVCLCLMDSERFLMHLDLDSEADQGLVFTPDFIRFRTRSFLPRQYGPEISTISSYLPE